jgi:hypothetical protein
LTGEGKVNFLIYCMLIETLKPAFCFADEYALAFWQIMKRR